MTEISGPFGIMKFGRDLSPGAKRVAVLRGKILQDQRYLEDLLTQTYGSLELGEPPATCAAHLKQGLQFLERRLKIHAKEATKLEHDL